MESLDTKPLNPPGVNDLRAQYDALRHLVLSILILVIVITLTFVLCLARLDRSVRQDLAVMRPQAAQMNVEYQRASGSFDSFISKITEYGRTHPDFTPILVKYGLKPTTPTGTPTAGSPWPPPTTAPKK